MTSKKANWLFLTVILTHIGTVLILSFAGERISIGIFMNFLLSQGIVVVPTLLFWLIFESRIPSGQRLAEPPMFGRIKITTVMMVLLCTFLIMPLVAVLNALTMFFTDNTFAAMEGDILDAPFLLMLFMIGILGPFCEEFVFRGVMYRSYRRGCGDCFGYRRGCGDCFGYRCSSHRGIAAVLLSALMFGLMHMNFNQALYAFGIGIFLALLVEAAGSLWASVFCHMFFNSLQVVMMYLSGYILESVYGQAVGETAQTMTARELMAALSVYLVIAAVTTPIAVCILVWIAKNEGRPGAVGALFHGSEGQETAAQRSGATEPLLSVPLIIAVVLCLGYMSLELFL